MLFRCFEFLEERAARSYEFDSHLDAVDVNSRTHSILRCSFAREELGLALVGGYCRSYCTLRCPVAREELGLE